MAVQPTRSGDGRSGLGQMLQIVGAVVGGVKGGPGGAAAGAQLGSMAGNTLDPPKQQAGPEVTGMQQRQEMLELDPVARLQRTKAALNQMPAGELPETRRAIDQALMFAEKQQQPRRF